MPSFIEMMDQAKEVPIQMESQVSIPGYNTQEDEGNTRSARQEYGTSIADRDRILASLPEDAWGPGMSILKYRALRKYIAENAPIRLVDYHGDMGTVIRVTPPIPEVPAGTITMIYDNGGYLDGSSKCFRYPDGTPVADVCFTANRYTSDTHYEEF